jgi:hypothetical protein
MVKKDYLGDVLVCSAAYWFMMTDFVVDLVKLCKKMDILFSTERNIPMARSALVELFLKSKKYRYLLFIDTDQCGFNYTHVVKMREFIRKNNDECIISGVYLTRDKHLCYGFFNKRKSKGFFKEIRSKQGRIQVDWTGLGFVMIPRKVLKSLEMPLFLSYNSLGEDIYFFTKVKKAGFKVYADKKIRIGHTQVANVLP